VDDVMVSRAHRHEIRQIGWPTSFPWIEVVHLATLERHVAPVERAGAIHRTERSSLFPAGVPNRSAGVEGSAVRIDDDRGDTTVAEQASDRCRR
jgi:hypothetical protein